MGATSAISSLALLNSSCLSGFKKSSSTFRFTPLAPSTKDEVLLAEGYKSEVLLSWGDKLNKRGLELGFNCDYLAYIPLKNKTDEGILWVNHEYVDPMFIHSGDRPKGKAALEKEMDAIGGSLLHIKKGSQKWEFVFDSPYNRRITARTPIPMISDRPIEGKKTAIGTLANCAGGVTPWGSILTCEENFQNYYGDNVLDLKTKKKVWTAGSKGQMWTDHFKYPPEHYGWVVEVNPLTGEAKKLISMGRFAHESATTILAKDGRCVVYSGDDKADECLYKFISAKPGSLEQGELFVADTKLGIWKSLKLEGNKALKDIFSDQTEVLIHAREASRILGGTPLDRPEDIEIDPKTKAVYVALTGNRKNGNPYGSILKIEEKNQDPLALEFSASQFVAGGPETGLSSPDNLCFDQKGNLWVTNDMSPSVINNGDFEKFGNNGLFVIPLSGPSAGVVHQVASAPVRAEFTGPFFSPDGKTLFLSVQHPGERSPSMDILLSHWPGGGTSVPRSSIIQISGPFLDI